LKYYVCKICGLEVRSLEEGLIHLVREHRKHVERWLPEVTVKCDKCGREFRVKPKAVVTVRDEVKFIVPAFCGKCFEPQWFVIKFIEKL